MYFAFAFIYFIVMSENATENSNATIRQLDTPRSSSRHPRTFLQNAVEKEIL